MQRHASTVITSDKILSLVTIGPLSLEFSNVIYTLAPTSLDNLKSRHLELTGVERGDFSPPGIGKQTPSRCSDGRDYLLCPTAQFWLAYLYIAAGAMSGTALRQDEGAGGVNRVTGSWARLWPVLPDIVSFLIQVHTDACFGCRRHF
jgi:hypothetical protein